MNLLLGRRQSRTAVFSLVPLRFGSGVVFYLKAELELEPEEAALIKKYRFAKAQLVISNPFDDFKQAIRSAIIVGLLTLVVVAFSGPVLAFLLSWQFFAVSGLAPALSILVTVVMTVVYFRALREEILVSDLLDGGRTFHCDSIIALIKKEAFLERICEYLRQVLESAKHWDEREVVHIRPLDKGAAKQAVLHGA